MKVIASLAALLLAGPALAQTAPASQTPVQTAPASSVTRDLNSGPPAPATYLAPAPTPAPAVTNAPAPAATITPARTSTSPVAASPAPTTRAPATVVRPSLPTAPAPTSAPAATQPRATAPATTAPVRPAPAPVVPTPAATTPAAAAATAPAVEPAPPPPPAYTVLDAPARAALPFSLNLPSGFQIDAERSGPDFKMYAVRRNGTPFVMIYAGPSSEFPIYSGEVVEAAGRSSVVATEDGQRHAMEHLFQRETAPREVHIWVSSLDGADRALAEAIAQSVDVH